MKALVVRNTGSSYMLLNDEGIEIEARVKGKLRLRGIKATNPIAIGDFVEYESNELGLAQIVDIYDRRNFVVRKATNLSKQFHVIASNVDQALLIVTIKQPTTYPAFIDRFLASAQIYGVEAIIVLNKIDVLNEDEMQEARAFAAIYQSIGYDVVFASAEQGIGIDEIRDRLVGKTTLLSGNSGVGKSTIINRLLPDLNVATKAISKLDTGMHTTTFSAMYRLEGQEGFVIDTPGIKGFGLFDMKSEDIAAGFREIFRISADCRFGNCSHTHEPRCAVVEALNEGRIAMSRYKSYLSMLNDDENGKYRPAQ